MIVDKLPSVLQHPRGSLSVERALKNIKLVLEGSEPDKEVEDSYWAALDDIESMLEKGFS